MLLVPVAILRKIGKEFTEEGVDLEVVLGALCAYLFIGAYFAFLYDVMANLSKSPFFAQPGADGKLNYLYFSFITLTTTGYGDISPAFGPGRMIAVTEAVIGQLYLVSVVAIVVSAFGKRKKSPSFRRSGMKNHIRRNTPCGSDGAVARHRLRHPAGECRAQGDVRLSRYRGHPSGQGDFQGRSGASRESPVSTCWATAWTRSSPAPSWRTSPSAASTCSITSTMTISSAGY